MTSTSTGVSDAAARKREIYAECFKKYDADGSNSIDVSELGSLLKDMGWNVTDADVVEALKVLDKDGNGDIDLDEFLHWSSYAWEKFVLQSPVRTKLNVKNDHMASLSEMPEMDEGEE